MRSPLPLICLLLGVVLPVTEVSASEALLEDHCFKCHNDEKSKGDFKIAELGAAPMDDNFQRWLDALDLVIIEDMPPEDESELTADEREQLVAYLEQNIKSFEAPRITSRPRRMNNREFANSVRDALLLEDVGTHFPLASLVGDSRHHGFDTHGETLGMSRFHLENYVEAIRIVLDATLQTGEKPEAKRYRISARGIEKGSVAGAASRHASNKYRDFSDPRDPYVLKDLPSIPTTGRYRITIRATGVDRTLYATEDTGFYHADPIQLNIQMGDREHLVDLPDETAMDIELDEWLAAGTELKFWHETDAFRLLHNGGFKHQRAIAGAYLKETNPAAFRRIYMEQESLRKRFPERPPDHSVFWRNEWHGARPRLYSVAIEGPLYESWPSKRQVALLGENPTVEQALEILKPIAERAWRRLATEDELAPMVASIEENAERLGIVDAYKEGILGVLISPAFLILDGEDLSAGDRFASKLSYFLEATLPPPDLRAKVAKEKLSSFESVRRELKRRIDRGKAEALIEAFPYSWLELADINFMSPDPVRFPFYDRKQLGEDMVNEALAFFRHLVENNRPVTELISADYSFVNADLARIYRLEGVPEDSRLRQYTFTDGRRGGLLGMGAFLTSTADTQTTSPIHRAVYVMENLMGIHPSPPPPDIVITEPDVRNAKTIREVLAAHTNDTSCASCHATIDPWGFAFENFSPTGAWRDDYRELGNITMPDRQARPMGSEAKPVDASARFRNGTSYSNIEEFKQLIMTDANRDRFIRCFISKLLTYANGAEPTAADYPDIDQILSKSAENEYRIVDTIAAVMNSPLFRSE